MTKKGQVACDTLYHESTEVQNPRRYIYLYYVQECITCTAAISSVGRGSTYSRGTDPWTARLAPTTDPQTDLSTEPFLTG